MYNATVVLNLERRRTCSCMYGTGPHVKAVQKHSSGLIHSIGTWVIADLGDHYLEMAACGKQAG